ncbi:hypothetical protein C8R44DRAFT_807902, partial [Mycena epipterygia]
SPPSSPRPATGMSLRHRHALGDNVSARASVPTTDSAAGARCSAVSCPSAPAGTAFACFAPSASPRTSMPPALSIRLCSAERTALRPGVHPLRPRFPFSNRPSERRTGG